MSKRSFWQWLVVSALVLSGVRVGVARAQTAPQTEQQAQRPVVGSRAVQQLTPQQQLRSTARTIEEMMVVRRTVSQMLDRANQERDIIKVNCLNDKLTQIDVAIRSTREHADLLQTAVSVSNDNQRNHEYSLVLIYQQRVRALEVEARQCVGEEAAGFGEGTEIGVRVAPTIPTEDVDFVPGDLIDVFFPPTLSAIR
jgi:regulator of PEP synthase PpsR (kinase-PPPase family)